MTEWFLYYTLLVAGRIKDAPGENTLFPLGHWRKQVTASPARHIRGLCNVKYLSEDEK